MATLIILTIPITTCNWEISNVNSSVAMMQIAEFIVSTTTKIETLARHVIVLLNKLTLAAIGWFAVPTSNVD